MTERRDRRVNRRRRDPCSILTCSRRCGSRRPRARHRRPHPRLQHDHRCDDADDLQPSTGHDRDTYDTTAVRIVQDFSDRAHNGADRERCPCEFTEPRRCLPLSAHRAREEPECRADDRLEHGTHEDQVRVGGYDERARPVATELALQQHHEAQADPESDTAGLLARYPKAAAGDMDGDPRRLTEMDALVAYLQMLGTLVDFQSYHATDNER